MSILAQIVERTGKDLAERRKLVPEADLRARVSKSTRDFRAALAAPGLSVIAEYKPRSPSSGPLREGPPDDQIRAYDRAASAISVLCDRPYFDGGYELLRSVRALTDRPILAKDFVVSAYQILEARDAGADAVLLMASVLTEPEIAEFLALADQLGMAALVEAHDTQELHIAITSGAPIVGVNSRDLKTMKIDLERARSMLARVPPDRIRVAESGIEHPAGMAVVRDFADAALVGTALMRSEDPAGLIGTLRTEVKICGVRTEASALACEAAQVTYAGFNFVGESRRYVRNDEVPRLRELMPSVRTVGVFRNAELEMVHAVASLRKLDVVQLHGDEPPDWCAKLNPTVIKAVKVDEDFDPAKVAAYREAGARILFDGPSPGRGQAFDPARLADIDVGNDLIAGGLTPDNVGAIVERLRPRGVDTASGVETDGEIDPARIEGFAKAARGVK